MNKALLLLLGLMAIVAVASAVSAPADRNPLLRNFFNKWKAQHNKVYASIEEEEKRFGIFKANLEFIREHNKQNNTYRLGMNEFGDMTNEEFRAGYNNYRRNADKVVDPSKLFKNPQTALPASFDWRTEGAVTGVKNQGQCGGCWSFSATGSMEGQWFIAKNPLVGLSEQNLIDCATEKYGNDGCQGGQMDGAFQYVIDNQGIDSEASYPYTATGPNACRYNVANKAAYINSYKNVASGSEADLQAAAYNVGPVSVAIDASLNSFQFYQSGVYYAPGCSSTNLDHGVLVVGYGSSNGQDYWIVKNSWGTSWGMEGYIWMARNRNNNCGIATDASYPLISGGSTTSAGGGSTNSGSGRTSNSGSSSSGKSSAASSSSSSSSASSSSGSSSSGSSATGSSGASATGTGSSGYSSGASGASGSTGSYTSGGL